MCVCVAVCFCCLFFFIGRSLYQTMTPKVLSLCPRTPTSSSLAKANSKSSILAPTHNSISTRWSVCKLRKLKWLKELTCLSAYSAQELVDRALARFQFRGDLAHDGEHCHAAVVDLLRTTTNPKLSRHHKEKLTETSLASLADHPI